MVLLKRNARFFESLNYWNTLTHNKHPGFILYAGSDQQERGYPELVSWQSIDRITHESS